MKTRTSIAGVIAILATFVTVSFSSAADCRGNNHFTGNASPPPQTNANVCTK